MPRTNPLISTSAIPMRDRILAERRLLNRTMYGINDIIRVDSEGDNLVYRLNTTGETFSTAKDAFDAVGKTGMTTFGRITGDLESSSYNLRGLGGLEQRLKTVRDTLATDVGLANRLGIDDPNLIRFEIASFKSGIGNKQSLRSIVDQVGENLGVIVPDDASFNLLRVFSGEKEMTVGEISRLFSATSEGLGGILSTEDLIEALGKGPQSVASMYSKSGKRVKGAIALRDISLAGEDLGNLLEQVSGTTKLDTKSVRIFKVDEDLRNLAQRYIEAISSPEASAFSDASSRRSFATLTAMDKISGEVDEITGVVTPTVEGLERKAFYSKSGAMDVVTAALKNLKILDDDGNVLKQIGSLTEAEQKILTSKFESAYDGTSVLNSKMFNSIRAQVKNELESLRSLSENQRSQQFVTNRIAELTSQLDNLEGDNFQAITARIFMNIKEGETVLPRMIKAVVDQAGFSKVLDQYSILTTDVALKAETAIMGTDDSINLVLQGEAKARVYYDPLAPAFHYDMFSDPTYIKANETRQNRIISSLNHAIETGEVRGNLRRQIYQSAEANLDAVPEAARDSAQRNRMFMRQLKEAIESGMDIRTMPQLLNYLKKNASADLFRIKDGIYQPALEDAFRLSLDTEASFFSGRANKAARLGEGLRDMTILGRNEPIKALTFQVQGHKMLFAGDAASMFKHSLGGFDLDDKGIIMPRIFKDASGEDRLGTFLFRQPTGPGEFIFGKADLRNTDTIKLFLQNNDALMNELDIMKESITGNALLDSIHEGLTASGRRKSQLDNLIGQQSSDQIEDFIIALMKSAEQRGSYSIQRVDMNSSFFKQLEGKEFTSPLALTRENIKAAAEAGLAKEKYLVQQYNYGNMLRIFATEGSFDYSDEIHRGLSTYVSSREYGTLNTLRGEYSRLLQSTVESEISAGLAKQKEYGQAIAKIMKDADADTRAGISSLFDEDLSKKSRQAILKQDTIGQYINRLTVASAGADQQEAILARLQGKVDDSVLSALRNTKIATFAPSDVVDLIVNLNEGIGVEGVENLERLYGGAIDKESAAKAIMKISGIAEDAGVSVVEATGRQMIDSKFELLGKLRALSMQNLVDQDDYKNMLAGIDNVILDQRLKGDDVTGALKSFQRGFDDISSATNVSEEMTEYSRRIKDAFSGGDEGGIKQNLKGLLGLDAESPFAHASKSAKLGQQAKDAMDVVDNAIFKLNQVAYAGEIVNSKESSIIASNILQEAESMMQTNSQIMNDVIQAGDEASEFLKYNAPRMQGQVIDKVRSMIFEASNQSEGTTVRQLLDAMEMQMSGRYKGVRRIMSQPGYSDENTLLNMFRARQQERAASFLNKQEGISALTEQYDEMVRNVNSMSIEERREILAIAEDMMGKSRRGSAIVDEDQFKIAAALLVDSEKGIEKLGLDELTEKAVRQMRMLQQAKSTVTELGMNEILSFGGRASASGYAPSAIDLTDEERSNLFRGLDGEVADETQRPVEAGYKRIGKEFFDKPIVKKSGYAVAGLIAASFIYSASKDRSQSDIAGPPLLPGGSAYEAMAQRQPQVPEGSMFSGYDQGVSYSVNIEGSREQAESFSNSIGSVARGAVNSTMYRGLPQLGKDPYSQIAGSY